MRQEEDLTLTLTLALTLALTLTLTLTRSSHVIGLPTRNSVARPTLHQVSADSLNQQEHEQERKAARSLAQGLGCRPSLAVSTSASSLLDRLDRVDSFVPAAEAA